MEVISKATEAEQAEIKAYMEHTPITVKLSDSPYIFDIDITVKSEHHTANVRIVGHHTNIVHTEKDGEILLDTCADTPAESTDSGICDRSSFSVKTILEFVECAELCDIETPVKRQIDYNTRIAKEGLSGSWGANIGKVLLETYGDDVKSAPEHGGCGQRRAYERLLPAGRHRFRQRQSGNDSFSARCGVCKRIERRL